MLCTRRRRRLVAPGESWCQSREELAAQLIEQTRSYPGACRARLREPGRWPAGPARCRARPGTRAERGGRGHRPPRLLRPRPGQARTGRRAIRTMKYIDVLLGECHCRCGEKVALAKRSYTRDGIVKGFPLWYIDGHVGFKRPEIIDADPIEINGYRCRLIPLTQGQFAMVSPHRYKDLMRWKWYAWWNPTTRSYYAVRTVQMPDGRRVSIYMCRFILGLEPAILLPAIMQKPEIP